MTVYTFSAARQRLAALLDEAQRQGGVRIKRRDGTEFEISPVRRGKSPLDVEGVPLGLRAEEIVSALREVRRLLGAAHLGEQDQVVHSRHPIQPAP